MLLLLLATTQLALETHTRVRHHGKSEQCNRHIFHLLYVFALLLRILNVNLYTNYDMFFVIWSCVIHNTVHHHVPDCCADSPTPTLWFADLRHNSSGKRTEEKRHKKISKQTCVVVV